MWCLREEDVKDTKPFLFDTPPLLLSLDAAELVFRHLLCETWSYDGTCKLLPRMTPEEGSAGEDDKAPITAEVRPLVHPVEVLPVELQRRLDDERLRQQDHDGTLTSLG